MVLSAKAYNSCTTALQSYNFVALCPGLDVIGATTMANTIAANLGQAHLLYLCLQDKETSKCVHICDYMPVRL